MLDCFILKKSRMKNFKNLLCCLTLLLLLFVSYSKSGKLSNCGLTCFSWKKCKGKLNQLTNTGGDHRPGQSGTTGQLFFNTCGEPPEGCECTYEEPKKISDKSRNRIAMTMTMFSTMGKIIFCDDLILRVDDKEDLTNVTEWLIESTEYRPASPESCIVRSEMTSTGKISIILVVWLGLILFTFLYFYFCEWKLFPKRNRLKEMADLGYDVGECIESCPSRADKKRTSLSSLTSTTGVSCDGTCCSSDVQEVSRPRHSFTSFCKSPSMTSFRSSSSGYGSSTKLIQLDGSPKQRRPRIHNEGLIFSSSNRNLNRRIKVTRT